MNIFEELRKEEIKKLVERYHELYGYYSGYHWEEFGTVEDYKKYLRDEIAKKEAELDKLAKPNKDESK